MAISLKRKSKEKSAPPPEAKDNVAPEASGGEKKKRFSRKGKGKSKKYKEPKKVNPKKKCFVIIIGDDGGILIYMHGAKVVRRLFAPTPKPSHTEAMREIMSANSNVPVYILADVLDQQYVAHTFPPVSSLSVGGLVKRRMERDFQPEDMKGALPLGRDKDARKEWRYLLVALAKTPLMSEWLDMVVELPNRLQGVYLVPIEAMNYIPRLHRRLQSDEMAPWQLLISHNKVSGFRQVVMHDDKLVFTRVSQAIDDAIPAVIAGNIEQEIINTIEYLKRLGFQDSTKLEATVIVSQDVIETLDLKRFNFAHAQALSPIEVAETLKLEQAALSADRFGDVVMGASFGVTRKHRLAFSNAYIDKLTKLYKSQLLIKGVAALIILGLVGLIIMTGTEILGHFEATTQAKKKAESLQKNIAKLQQSVNSLDKDATYKSAIVSAYDAYIKEIPKPQDFISRLQPFVTTQHRITQFNWTYKLPSPKEKPPANGSEVLPLTVETEFDFAGSGGSPEVLTKAAGQLSLELKTEFSQFDITNKDFPWVKQDKGSIALELKQTTTLMPKDMLGTFIFNGLKKTNSANTPPGAPPANGKP